MTARMVRPIVVVLITVAVLLGCRWRRASGQPNERPGEKHLTPLMEAVRADDLARVEQLIEEGVDVNAADDSGYTALHYAAHCGDIRIVKALVKGGTNVNARTKESVTPLVASIDMACGKPEISLALIDAGADVNIPEADGGTALWFATTESSPQVIEALLRKGANPNTQPEVLGFEGNTPLHLAASNGLQEVVRLLLRFGARANLRNAKGQMPIDVVNPKWPEIRDLLERAGKEQRP